LLFGPLGGLTGPHASACLRFKNLVDSWKSISEIYKLLHYEVN
jgi:hypothetical protein